MKKIILGFAALCIAVVSSHGGVNVTSPLFANRNTAHVDSLDSVGIQYAGLKTLDGGFNYAAYQSAAQAPAQNPGSLSASSVCIGSACAGSICLGSACAGSICFGSACAASTCSGSGCASSTCGGSVCLGSVCAGSVCVGSVCAGTACAGSDCGGGESFPLVAGCDYRIENNRVVLTLSVSQSAKLVGGGRTTSMAVNSLNRVPIAGAYQAVNVQQAGTGVELTLVDTAGERITYMLQRG